jgi:hypothetical protein
MAASECENGPDRPLHKTGIRELFRRSAEIIDAFGKERGLIDDLANVQNDQPDVRRETSSSSPLPTDSN